MTFREGQIVRVVKQSRTVNAHIPMVGMVGFIDDEPKGDGTVSFVDLQENGRSDGCGGIPEECVVPETDEKWTQAKLRYERRIRENGRQLGVRWGPTTILDVLIDHVR